VSGISVSERNITQDGQSITINIIKPEFSQGILPAFMFFHGGGWILGDYPTHERIVRDIVVESGATAIFVNYTPSPEAHYPVAINQDYAATKWVAEHGSEIGVDGKRLALVGNSVGGYMSTVFALMCKDKNGPEIKLQVLLWPTTDANSKSQSVTQFATGRFLTKNLLKWCWDNYIPNQYDRKEIYASPLLATTEQLRGLPPALVLTAENDVIRDEGEAYARKMDEAGVKVTATRYNGMIHDWGLLNPLSNLPETRSAIIQVGAELKKALQ